MKLSDGKEFILTVGRPKRENLYTTGEKIYRKEILWVKTILNIIIKKKENYVILE